MARFTGILQSDGGVLDVMDVADGQYLKRDGSTVVGAVAGSATLVWNQTPTGVVDGANATFTLWPAPSGTNRLILTKNGMVMRPGAGNDFTLATMTITFADDNIPRPGDILLATYQV